MPEFPVVALPRTAARHRRRVVPEVREDVRELRGLLHDVGHGLATLTVLLEVAREDAPGPASAVLDLVEREAARLLGVVYGGSRYTPALEPVEVREVLEPIAVLADRTQPASVWLRPGDAVHLRTDPTLLGRVVANLIDNAVRTAGPDGFVEIVVSRDVDVLVDVIDDGPGFHRTSRFGVASLGMAVVTRLLATCGGRLEIDTGRHGGTRMRVVLPDRAGQPGRMR